MWLSNIKKKGKRSIDEKKQPDLAQLLKREHLHELNDNNAVLRIWVPELCKHALDEITETNCVTRAKYLRELFVVYLYGEHELLRMRKQKTGIYYVPPPATDTSDILFQSAPAELEPDLGKNIFAIKLFLPQTIKDDLQKRADITGIPLSTFVREILTSHLLGHTLWRDIIRSCPPDEVVAGKEWEDRS